jgi:L-2,4-diaminobutyrate decarboxylase
MRRPVQSIQQRAFDAEHFRSCATLVVERLADYLADHSVRGLALQEPAVLRESLRELMTEDGDSFPSFDRERLGKIVDLFIASGIQVHSPGSMGRQFTGILPLPAILDMVGSIVNQPASFYEAGQLPIMAERLMAAELNRFIGYDPERFAMVTTSGGSLATLTAMLAARNHAFPDFWQRGGRSVRDDGIPAVMVSEDVHYSVSRAAGILGIGAEQVIKLPVDDGRRIRADSIPPALQEARARGLKVFCLVATAGSTSVGAFDPIDQIADVTEEEGIWLHVDGAHGTSLLVSDLHRRKLAGVARADSLVWDAHKLLFISAPCTLLFYRDRSKSLGAFRQQASYVFEKEPDQYTLFDSAEMNFECTKRPMIVGLWAAWSLYGRSLFADKLEYLCTLTSAFYEYLQTQPDFQVLHRPECNICCFRYVPYAMSDEDLDEFQIALRNAIREAGTFFVSKVELSGIAALRCVFSNHLTTMEHCIALLETIREIGQGWLAGAQPARAEGLESRV